MFGVDEKKGNGAEGEVLGPVPTQQQQGREDGSALRGITEEVLPTLDLVVLGKGASWLRQ